MLTKSVKNARETRVQTAAFLVRLSKDAASAYVGESTYQFRFSLGREMYDWELRCFSRPLQLESARPTISTSETYLKSGYNLAIRESLVVLTVPDVIVPGDNNLIVPAVGNIGICTHDQSEGDNHSPVRMDSRDDICDLLHAHVVLKRIEHDFLIDVEEVLQSTVKDQVSPHEESRVPTYKSYSTCP